MVLLSTVWDGRWLVYRLQAAQRRPAEAGTPAAGISNIVLKSVLFASERPPYPKIEDWRLHCDQLVNIRYRRNSSGRHAYYSCPGDSKGDGTPCHYPCRLGSLRCRRLGKGYCRGTEEFLAVDTDADPNGVCVAQEFGNGDALFQDSRDVIG